MFSFRNPGRGTDFIASRTVFLRYMCINKLAFFQEAAEELAPRLEIILQHLLCAFGKYQVLGSSH